MSYESLEACLLHLEKNNQLLRIKEEVDPHLEMAAMQLLLYRHNGPAVLFERVKGSPFRACCNVFGSLERCKFIFRDTMPRVQKLIEIRNNPAAAIKQPFRSMATAWNGWHALPQKAGKEKPVMFHEVEIKDLPQIKHWPQDGGAFITLPQVYTEDPQKPGIANSNLGMYRIQLSGNNYVPNRELGLHYQIHRGIGVHQAHAASLGKSMPVSIFVGGPPAHTVAAVMPLPEGMSEINFAGLLAGRRFQYTYEDGHCISTDADFVITGEVFAEDVKPEGPFGDHLGYYSLAHPFPVMKVHKVYARQNAIWPFTVVGRPPQEDTSFGQLIHELTGSAIRTDIPGIKEVHAVDAAGVHPLLLAVGTERYTPYAPQSQPMELLTQANRVLGTGQLSLAKFLVITAGTDEEVSTANIPQFFRYVLERINFERDLHFQTETTIDTLDYSGMALNKGSKLVMAAYGPRLRTLAATAPALETRLQFVMPGVVAISAPPFTTYDLAAQEMERLAASRTAWEGIAMVVVTEDAAFLQNQVENFLWVTFTRTNPSHDVYGVGSFVRHKHWGCTGPIIFDARKKPHHAPELVPNAVVMHTAAEKLKRAGFNQL